MRELRGHTMSWIAQAERDVATVASMLGIEVRRAPSAHHCACPACRSERRHPNRHDRRGAVGIPVGTPTCWRCHVCGLGGDAVDFVSCALHGDRFGRLHGQQRHDVREWFERSAGLAVRGTAPQTIVLREPVYPPRGELLEFARQLVHVSAHEPAAAYLVSRGIDAARVEQLNLARTLQNATTANWATLGSRTWSTLLLHLIVPVFDCDGAFRSVVARSIERAPMLKSAAPTGYGRGGLVMANEKARALLSGKCTAPASVLIREGEIDFLTSATTCDDNLAVFGVVSGSWTARIAARIPYGSDVTIATDADATGDKYAQAITATLSSRARLTRERRAA